MAESWLARAWRARVRAMARAPWVLQDVRTPKALK